MTTTDWIIDLALLLVVFRQLREGRVDARFFLIPLALVGFTAHSYLHSIPTAGNDLVLVGILMAVGAALGIAGGIFTRVRVDGPRAFVQAGAVSAALWVAGMGSRMGFQLWSSHGGGDTLARFSVGHDITSSQAWVAAFVLMALAEVVTRLATIAVRAYRARTAEQARPFVLA